MTEITVITAGDARPADGRAACPALEDHRFSTLLEPGAWAALPAAVRKRFGKRVTDGASTVYQGRVVAMRLSRVGRVLAQAARLIGGPLPYDCSSVGQPAVVTVTEDRAGRGQFWVRQYGRAAGFPQVIHSSKRFAGPTGIEEYVGRGIGMALRVEADGDVLLFKSDHYFVQLGRQRVRLPRWLSPGALTIAHRDEGDGWFLFSLTLVNGVFGELVHQDALFRDGEG